MPTCLQRIDNPDPNLLSVACNGTRLQNHQLSDYETLLFVQGNCKNIWRFMNLNAIRMLERALVANFKGPRDPVKDGRQSQAAGTTNGCNRAPPYCLVNYSPRYLSTIRRVRTVPSRQADITPRPSFAGMPPHLIHHDQRDAGLLRRSCRIQFA